MALNFANNNSLSAITAKPSGLSGSAMNLISTQTASSSSTISFTSGIDSTYDEYVFKFYDIHPSEDSRKLEVNFRDGGSSYDATKTTTSFLAYTYEGSENPSALGYDTDLDVAQGTGVQPISSFCGNDNDQSVSGYLHLFNPSSTTFVKHFISKVSSSNHDNSAIILYIAGYCNVTAAIDGVQFKFNSGNIDSGVIKLYGIS
jgi:hypothetical protein